MSARPPGEITQLLAQLSAGNEASAARVFPLVYDELRRLSAAALRRERRGHTLQTTALVHEAFLKLVGERKVQWESRAHFMAIAAQAMRRILVDHARRRRASKRGDGDAVLSLEELSSVVDRSPVDLVDLDIALGRLGEKDARLGRLVELRFFGGLTVEETACVLGLSDRTVKRDWQIARAWLRRELSA